MEVICFYVEIICKVIGYMVSVNLEYCYLYLEECEVKCVGYIIVFIDCGLCGGLNINLFKNVVVEM